MYVVYISFLWFRHVVFSLQYQRLGFSFDYITRYEAHSDKHKYTHNRPISTYASEIRLPPKANGREGERENVWNSLGKWKLAKQEELCENCVKLHAKRVSKRASKMKYARLLHKENIIKAER